MSRAKLPPYPRKRSCVASFYGKTTISITTTQPHHNQQQIMSNVITIPEKYANDLPRGMIPLDNQVAGHTFQHGTDAIGLLKDQQDGSIMKPATKPLCGAREIKFYENLQTTKDSDMCLLKELVPEYRGKMTVHMGGRNVS